MNGILARHPVWLLAAVTLFVVGRQTAPAFEDRPFFSTAAEESFSTYQMNGDGDLWPSCWARDDNLYTANGDGNGFGGTALRFDMAVSRIVGLPPRLSGETLATNLGTNWSGHDYNRKPTGMVCVNGSIFLAFQNLNLRNFSDAPAASIARSDDGGVSWRWNTHEPMFGTPLDKTSPLAYKFTTIFFLDYGRDSMYAPPSYIYAYGLDHNWREQSVLYLARVPKHSIQERSAWQFFSGLDRNGQPRWSADIVEKTPVLTDERKLYPNVLDRHGCQPNEAVVSQGGVVYDAPLKRYLFASWSCSTHELYEAPAPWGPWRLFLSKDFGRKTTTQNRGQYGTNIPSKYIAKDGKTLWLQSNVCCGGNAYTYSLRRIFLEPQHQSVAANRLSDGNLATKQGIRAISKSARNGQLCGVDCFDIMNSGNVNASEDDDDGEAKARDWWGYTWPDNYNFNEVVYQTGTVTDAGGWFSGGLSVQVRRSGLWVDVTGLSITPPYSFGRSLPSHTVTTFRFDPAVGDGVRVVGAPGGDAHFTSVSQLAVYFKGENLIDDNSFEFQSKPDITAPWRGEGNARKGITRFEQQGHSGVSNAWLEGAADQWNGLSQTIKVEPQTRYQLSAWVRADLRRISGRLGVRDQKGGNLLAEARFGSSEVYRRVTLNFKSGNTDAIEIYIGLQGEDQSRSLQIDDVALEKK